MIAPVIPHPTTFRGAGRDRSVLCAACDGRGSRRFFIRHGAVYDGPDACAMEIRNLSDHSTRPLWCWNCRGTGRVALRRWPKPTGSPAIVNGRRIKFD